MDDERLARAFLVHEARMQVAVIVCGMVDELAQAQMVAVARSRPSARRWGSVQMAVGAIVVGLSSYHAFGGPDWVPSAGMLAACLMSTTSWFSGRAWLRYQAAMTQYVELQGLRQRIAESVGDRRWWENHDQSI